MLQETQKLSSVKGNIRAVQEWFRLLKNSGFVVIRNKGIYLSEIAIAQVEQLQEIIEFHSQDQNFWIPDSFIKEAYIEWYEYFGNPNLERQWFTQQSVYSKNYIEENYLTGVQPSDVDSGDIDTTSSTITTEVDINLRPFTPNVPEARDINEAIDFAAILKGRIRLRDKTRQHQEILARLAARLTELSYNLADDPNSVDLLAEKNGVETIFEVKTINRRNFLPRIRLGVGQLSEYRYRRQLQTQSRPNSILVLSSTVQLPTWTPDYLSSDVRIGLLCSTATSFVALTNGLVELEIQDAS